MLPFLMLVLTCNISAYVRRFIHYAEMDARQVFPYDTQRKHHGPGKDGDYGSQEGKALHRGAIDEITEHHVHEDGYAEEREKESNNAGKLQG